jgi:hypothetical protein
LLDWGSAWKLRWHQIPYFKDLQGLEEKIILRSDSNHAIWVMKYSWLYEFTREVKIIISQWYGEKTTQKVRMWALLSEGEKYTLFISRNGMHYCMQKLKSCSLKSALIFGNVQENKHYRRLLPPFNGHNEIWSYIYFKEKSYC